MMLTLINGEPANAVVSVFDGAVLRGDGCFEALRSYGGKPFAFAEHHQRLTKSATALRLPLPEYSDLRTWVERCAADGGDCVVRILVTRGSGGVSAEAPPLWVVLWHPLPDPVTDLRLAPIAAPWHPGGESWELAGVKTLSYAANQAASRRAREADADDALLVSRAGEVLEGPTFAIAWVRGGVLETPSLSLGILESITRGFVVESCQELGIPVAEGRYPIDRLRSASEVVALSTIKEVMAVRRVGQWVYETGPVTSKLAASYRSRVQLTPPQTTAGSRPLT